MSPSSATTIDLRPGSSVPQVGEGAAARPLVCVIAYDGLCTFEFGIGVEVFGLPRPEFDSWYDFAVVAAEPGPLRAIGGISVEAEAGLDRLAEASLVLVPGWRGADEAVPSALIEALRQAHAGGARIASICSGVFVLAAAGLLDRRRATTHWRHVDKLAEHYPAIEIDPDVLYVDEGDVLTSAGSAAGLDLCLHIIRRDFGAAHANAVARRLVLPAQRQGGQRQFVQAPVPKLRGGQIAPLLDHVRSRLDEAWPVDRMAAWVGLSPRTFARRMTEAGMTPLHWLRMARVERAAELIETSDAALADVAAAAGFGSLESFRREFRRARGIAPSQHRARFGMARRSR